MTKSASLFEERQFQGQLGIENELVPITFKARLDDTGAVLLELEQIPLTAASAFIVHAWHDHSKGLPFFQLSGVSDDQVSLETKHLYFNSIGPHSSAERGDYFAFVADPVDVTLRRPSVKSCDRPNLTLWVRGFRCFPRVSASCETGRVTAQGDVKCNDRSKLSGHLSVQAQEAANDVQKWRQEAEALLNHVRRVMSFAEGATVSDPVMEFRYGTSIEVNIQSRNVHHDLPRPTIHMLDRQTIFETAIRSFAKPPHHVENLWMALEWFAMPASYSEARLINAMTALENLVSSNTRDVADLLDKKSFKKFATALNAPIEEFVTANALDNANPDLVDELTDRLQELRRRSLWRKLKTLLQRWSVPIDDLDKKKIRAALNARNTIVHEGRYYVKGSKQPSLSQHIDIVRELVARIVFRALGFEGRYLSQLGGYNDATFPSSS